MFSTNQWLRPREPTGTVHRPDPSLLDSIDLGSIVGLRDRALLGVMVYTFGRVGTVVSINIEDYCQSGKRRMFRLHEKGGKEHVVPANHNCSVLACLGPDSRRWSTLVVS